MARRLHQQWLFLLTLKPEDAVPTDLCGVRNYCISNLKTECDSVEDFALDHGNITVMNYAVGSICFRHYYALNDSQISAAVTNTSLWPSRANNSDFIHQGLLEALSHVLVLMQRTQRIFSSVSLTN